MKDTGEPPRVVLKWLYVLDLYEKDISRLGGFDLERPREIVDLSQVDIHDIVRTIVVLDLSARPVQAFNFDSLSILDGSAERYWIQGSQQRLKEVVLRSIPSGCHLFC